LTSSSFKSSTFSFGADSSSSYSLESRFQLKLVKCDVISWVRKRESEEFTYREYMNQHNSDSMHCRDRSSITNKKKSEDDEQASETEEGARQGSIIRGAIVQLSCFLFDKETVNYGTKFRLNA
jgi:hypothetical protein